MNGTIPPLHLASKFGLCFAGEGFCPRSRSLQASTPLLFATAWAFGRNLSRGKCDVEVSRVPEGETPPASSFFCTINGIVVRRSHLRGGNSVQSFDLLD